MRLRKVKNIKDLQKIGVNHKEIGFIMRYETPTVITLRFMKDELIYKVFI